MEVREALTQIRRKQALQDSERKGAEQEASLRWAPVVAVSGPAEWSWGIPWQGRRPPALGAKLLVDQRPQSPCGHSVGKRHSSPGSAPRPSPVITVTGSPALTIPGWGCGGDMHWASGVYPGEVRLPALPAHGSVSAPPDTGSGLRRTWCPGPHSIPGAPQGHLASWAAVTCSHCPQAVRADREAETGGAGP